MTRLMDWRGEIPFGASIGLIHSDRRLVKDTGGAVFFHFNNVYTLGYSKHGDDNG